MLWGEVSNLAKYSNVPHIRDEAAGYNTIKLSELHELMSKFIASVFDELVNIQYIKTDDMTQLLS